MKVTLALFVLSRDLYYNFTHNSKRTISDCTLFFPVINFFQQCCPFIFSCLVVFYALSLNLVKEFSAMFMKLARCHRQKTELQKYLKGI